MSNEISTPPADPVWWRSINKDIVGYTKCRLWVDARRELGGHPFIVTNKTLIKELEENANK